MSRHLLVIGAQRCGTTWLHDQLAAHPQIAMARPSRPEPKVFLSHELTARGLAWYRSTYFAHATDELVLGEKSTSYLEYAAAARRAATMLVDPVIVVQVRDPVARAVSHWSFSTDAGLETRGLVEALSANLAGPLPWDPELTSVSPFAYLERGRYTDYLAPWLAEFGPDVHVLVLEEVRSGPGRLAELYAALGVDPDVRPPAADRAVNQSRHPAPPLPEELLVELRAHFRDSDRALASLLGRDLPWQQSEQHAGDDPAPVTEEEGP